MLPRLGWQRLVVEGDGRVRFFPSFGVSVGVPDDSQMTASLCNGVCFGICLEGQKIQENLFGQTDFCLEMKNLFGRAFSVFLENVEKQKYV